MEYIITKGGVVTAHCCAAKLPEPEKGQVVYPCPSGFGGQVGDKVSDFTEDFSAYTKNKLQEIEQTATKQLETIKKEQEEQSKIKMPEQTEEIKAQIYLNSTDWYITRFAETGKPVPDEVTAKRAACRKLLSK